MDTIFIYITCKDKLEAIEIGKQLILSKLAGCINIFPPMTSIYKWKGELEMNEESVLIAKTRSDLYEKIKQKVKEIHSYSVPCILSIPIQNGNEEYLSWLESGLK